MRFLYQKLYCDIVMPSGDIAILYLTWLELWGWRQSACGIEWYAADGMRKVHQTHKPPQIRGDLHSGETLSFRLELPDIVDVLMTPQLAAWHPSGSAPLAALRWYNRVPRAEVRLTWQSEGKPTQEFVGEGYADWVTISRLPRRLPLRALQWGRLHLPETTVVYTHLEALDGSAWTRVGEWYRDAFQETHALTLSPIPSHDPIPSQDPSFSQIPMPLQAPIPSSKNASPLVEASGGWELALPSSLSPHSRYRMIPQRILHQGAAIHKERYPNPFARFLARSLSGSMHEIRYLSALSPCDEAPSTPKDGGSRNGWALHEEVFFGRAPRAFLTSM